MFAGALSLLGLGEIAQIATAIGSIFSLYFLVTNRRLQNLGIAGIGLFGLFKILPQFIASLVATSKAQTTVNFTVATAIIAIAFFGVWTLLIKDMEIVSADAFSFRNVFKLFHELGDK